MSFKPHFSRFLEADPARLHFAAHSHHLWPDVTFEAQQRCWLDAARLADGKWEALFAGLYPATQRQVADVLNLSDPTTIAFGPNTHGFLLRLLSCLPQDRPARVLTTDGEFHSFTRQIERLAEAGLVAVERVACEPFESFADRFAAAAARGGHDLVYFSQVFYNSGYVLDDLRSLVGAVAEEATIVAIDGYHGFLALPTDLSAITDRAFYLSGGYKYAMAGEGAAFLHAPPGYGPRPRDTGWYAAFGALAASSEAGIAYGRDGSRFLGATFDPVGIYRLNAVLTWLEEIAVDVAAIHAKVQDLQRRFVEGLAGLALTSLHPGLLVVPLEESNRGHFLTFRTERAGEIYRNLWDRKVITDYRGDRLRFGFGLYHDEADIERLCQELGEALD